MSEAVVFLNVSQGRSTPCIRDKLIQPLMTGILIMGPYKPLRTWVDEFIPSYMEIMGVDRPDRTCVFSGVIQWDPFRGDQDNTHVWIVVFFFGNFEGFP